MNHYTSDRDDPPVQLDTFLDVGRHLQPASDRQPIPVNVVSAMARSWGAVLSAMAENAPPNEHSSSPTWIHYELVFLCQHLELLPSDARTLVYPLCMGAYLNSEAREEAQLGDGILFQYGFEDLTRNRFSPPQQTALLAAWCFLASVSASGTSIEAARAVVWFLARTGLDELDVNIIGSVRRALHTCMPELPGEPDVASIARLSGGAWKSWSKELIELVDLESKAPAILARLRSAKESFADRLNSLISQP